MSEWCIFWICLFSYWSIKEIVYCTTYNKRKAIKELAKEKYDAEIERYYKLSREELIETLQNLIEESKESNDE